MSGLGIIAGGGDLPLAVAEAARQAGRDVFIVALRGAADDTISRFPHAWVALGEIAKMLKLLRDHGCRDILLAGRVARPRFSDIRPDTRSVVLLPRIIAAARKGDDALLRAVVEVFESEGFHTISVEDAAPGLVATEGTLGRVPPSSDDWGDIALGIKIVRQLGALDVGQAAVICAGLTLAVEAAEGTDAMIARVASLPESIRGTRENPKGILVKALKPGQDRKTDLPVIGVRTVKNAAHAGLAGIAVEAGRCLIVDRGRVIEEANQVGLFILGFSLLHSG